MSALDDDGSLSSGKNGPRSVSRYLVSTCSTTSRRTALAYQERSLHDSVSDGGRPARGNLAQQCVDVRVPGHTGTRPGQNEPGEGARVMDGCRQRDRSARGAPGEHHRATQCLGTVDDATGQASQVPGAVQLHPRVVQHPHLEVRPTRRKQLGWSWCPPSTASRACSLPGVDGDWSLMPTTIARSSADSFELPAGACRCRLRDQGCPGQVQALSRRRGRRPTEPLRPCRPAPAGPSAEVPTAFLLQSPESAPKGGTDEPEDPTTT